MNRKILNGSWQMHQLPDGEEISLEVPGSVISGLWVAGKIEDPYYRENEYIYYKRNVLERFYIFTDIFCGCRSVERGNSGTGL